MKIATEPKHLSFQLPSFFEVIIPKFNLFFPFSFKKISIWQIIDLEDKMEACWVTGYKMYLITASRYLNWSWNSRVCCSTVWAAPELLCH